MKTRIAELEKLVAKLSEEKDAAVGVVEELEKLIAKLTAEKAPAEKAEAEETFEEKEEGEEEEQAEPDDPEEGEEEEAAEPDDHEEGEESEPNSESTVVDDDELWTTVYSTEVRRYRRVDYVLFQLWGGGGVGENVDFALGGIARWKTKAT